MTAVVSASQVSLQLENGRMLFRDLEFSIDRGKCALVGINGVGKTTLARLLAGEISPTAGKVSCDVPPLLLTQTETPPQLSVTAHLAETYVWSLLGEELLEGIDREQLCSKLSGGEWMRVRLARSLEDRFIILDEPTNNLDRAGRHAVLQFIQGCKEGVLIISHDRECLSACDRIYELSNRGLQAYGGGFDFYWTEKQREREAQEASLHQAKQQRTAAQAARIEQLAKQEKRQRKGKKDAKRGGMPRILIGKRRSQAQVTSGRIRAATLQSELQSAHEVSLAFEALKQSPIMYANVKSSGLPSQKLVADALDFNVFVGRWLYPEALTFFLRGSVRVALRGPNGAGKSTLLRAIGGETQHTRGSLTRGELSTIALDQQLSVLDESASVLDNVRRCRHASEAEIRSELARFLFTKESVFQQVGSLSGGEKLRAALAVGFLTTPHPELLILDEPTNNLDLPNISFLESVVQSFSGAVIVVSHDETFLQNCQIGEELVLG